MWRGYRHRKWYRQYRASHVPQQPLLVAKYCLDKICSYQEMLREDITDSRRSLDALFASLDLEMAQSRSAGAEFSTNGHEDYSIRELELASERAEMNPMTQARQNELVGETSVKWQATYDRAKARDCTCPICIQPMQVSQRIDEQTLRKALKLLDCSHMYHAACLECFEQLGHDKCPVCRASYKSVIVQ